MHDLPDEFLADLLPVAKKLALATGAAEYNVLNNNGRNAHQVVDHVHFHVRPLALSLLCCLAAGSCTGLITCPTLPHRSSPSRRRLTTRACAFPPSLASLCCAAPALLDGRKARPSSAD